MRFIDEVRIRVKAGDGGDGAVAWRREKFVPRGGPAGGDGGDGGDVVLRVDPQLATLLDYRYVREHRARSGEHGRGSDQNGQNGPPLLLRVPPGTLVKDAASGEVLADLSRDGQRLVAARGGRGGLGNMNFATSTHQAPRYAEKGTPGEERELILELKLLAEVAIIGYPNAGKSTLISRISRARPKIADYPFTTLTPNLGVVSWRGQRSFVVADIPGLVQGAHAGAGLGLQFLRHAERCRALVHLVDPMAPGEGRGPSADYRAVNRELALYSPELARKPQVVAVTKMDLPGARERIGELERSMGRRRRKPEILAISSVTGQGLPDLIDAVAKILYPEAGSRRAPRKKVGKPRAPKGARA